MKSDSRPTRRDFFALGGAGMAFASLSGPVRAAKTATKAKIVIIGAGAAGTSMANRLVDRLDGATITLIDARAEHLYQPGLSLVAAGLKPSSYVVSKTTDWLPSGVSVGSRLVICDLLRNGAGVRVTLVTCPRAPHSYYASQRCTKRLSVRGLAPVPRSVAGACGFRH